MKRRRTFTTLHRNESDLKNHILTSGPIRRQVRDLALPSSIGLFFQTMYNIVDSYYAGQVSTDALAALGLSFPVFLLIIAMGGGLSRGASALIANAIGAGDQDQQQEFTSQSVSIAILLSIALMLVGLLTVKPLFQLLGASGDYLKLSLSYMNPIFLGTLFFVLTSLTNAILIANGDSKTFSRVLISGFFLNLILDPWFLYGGFGLPAFGIAGIAWATVVIQFVGCVYLMVEVLRRRLLDLSSWRCLLPRLRVYREISVQAVPASFNIMSIALGFFVTTYFLKTFGEVSVAAFGVTTRIEQLGLLPTMGLYSAIMALVGQNNGAGNFERVRETMRVCNRIGLVVNLFTSVIIFVFARPLMRIFTPDESVIQIGVTCLYIIAPVQWSYVMTSTHLAMLQAIKRPTYGFFESISRKVLLPLPFFYVCVTVYQFGINSIWFSIAGTNVFMTIITIIYARRTLAKIVK